MSYNRNKGVGWRILNIETGEFLHQHNMEDDFGKYRFPIQLIKNTKATVKYYECIFPTYVSATKAITRYISYTVISPTNKESYQLLLLDSSNNIINVKDLV